MKHHSHPDIIVRLKRAEGHLRSLIKMMEDERPCLELAQQLHAIERAIGNAKRELIQDHMEHCLDQKAGTNSASAREALREFKTLAKYL
jgi:hypothetical protein NreA